MSFLTKLFLVILLIALIAWGEIGIQSHNTVMQSGGVLTLVLGLVVLYIFTKMAFRVFGIIPALLVLASIVVFILYAIGAFSNGLQGVGANIGNFLGRGRATVALDDNSPSAPGIAENFPANEKPAGGSLADFVSPKPQAPAVDFSALPKIEGQATIVTAGKLIINGKYFVLYGLDAPDAGQTCADAKGRAYNCGQAAARWLRSWVNDFTVECRVMKTTPNGSMLGTCALGEYDIGAAVVNAGWAVAYTADTNVYKPYEAQAQKNARGLWQGKFYMPWDWRKLQSRRPKIQIIEPEGEGLFGLF